MKPPRLRAQVSLGAFGAHTPCGPAAAHMCLRRVVNTVRFLKACLFATLVLPRRTFRPPPCLPAVPHPAPLTKHWAPQDPRQDQTSGRVESGHTRNGTGPPVACADRDDFKHPLKRSDLDSSGGATGYVGRRRKIPAWKT